MNSNDYVGEFHSCGPISPCGVQIKNGQKWKENDGRFTRIVTIAGWDSISQTVQIKGVRTSWSKLSRFNDKSGGYSLVRES